MPKICTYRSSHQRCSMKKGALSNFAEFTGKHLCQNFAYNFIKKETLAPVFSRKFCEVSKNTFFTEQFWTTVLHNLEKNRKIYV